MASHRLHNREVIPSERKRAEQVLRQSEEKLRFMFEAIGEGITVTDLEGNIVEASEALLRMSGYSRKEELIGRNGLQFIAEKDRANAIEDMMKAVEGGYSAAREYTFVDKDGKEFDAEASGSVLRDSTGNPAGFISVIRDITERKRAEEVLRESEEKLRVMFESMSDGVAITDLKGKILDVNEAILRMSGFSREEIIGQDGFGLMPREDGKKIIEQGTKALKSETGTEKMSQEITPTSGREYDVDLSMGVLRDSSGDPTGFVAIVRDITERKQAEEALRESEEKYRALFDSTIDGVVIIDGETMKIVLANQTALKMYEFDSIEDISEINLLDYIHPDDRERAVRIIAEDMFEKDLRQVNEFRTITKDGQEKWFSALGTKIEYKGKPAGLVSFMDITERKQADEALRESEEKLRVTFESISDAVAVADLEGRLVQVNEAAVRMTGYSNKEELLGRNVLESIIAEKDRAKI
ncbi:MAG: hypothetical protein AMJ37_00410, partial [Dehalococcoidia bacterium DG_18]